MNAAIPRKWALTAFWVFVLCLVLLPVAVRASDTAELKSNMTNLMAQLQGLQDQVTSWRSTQDATTSFVHNEISTFESNLTALKTAVDSTSGKSGATRDGTAYFAQSLLDLSNNVSALKGMIASLKSGTDKQGYKGEVEQQLAALNIKVTTLTTALASQKPATLDNETRETLATIKSRLSQASAAPVWLNYLLMGCVVLSLYLSTWLLVLFRGQSASVEQKTLEGANALVTFQKRMEERLKNMEACSMAVQNSAREVGDFLARVETAVRAQLETVTQQLNSSKAAELAAGTARVAEEMAGLRRDTAGQMEQFRSEASREISTLRTESGGQLQKMRTEAAHEISTLRTDSAKQMEQLRAGSAALENFMGELQRNTGRWIADFENQTGRTLQNIKNDMHALEDLLWPLPFRDGGKLESSRESIRARATTGDKAAFALLLGLGQLQLGLAARDGDLAPLVDALERLGVLAYKFWKLEPDATVETIFEKAQAWGEEINRLLTENHVPLSVRIIMPRASFDMGTMLSEHSATGTTTRVREPLSWAVVSRGPDQPPKVLATGKVITE